MKKNPVMSMIVPGRRALGEDWRKISVFPEEDGSYSLENEATTAPADNTPIFVPALGNLSYEAVDYILEYKRKDQEYRKMRGLPVKRGWNYQEINQIFYDWMEFKLKAASGQTVSGPALTVQREKVRR